jgi:hypothetical protein
MLIRGIRPSWLVVAKRLVIPVVSTLAGALLFALAVKGLVGNLALRDGVLTEADVEAKSCQLVDTSLSCTFMLTFTTLDGVDRRRTIGSVNESLVRYLSDTREAIWVKYARDDPSVLTTDLGRTGPGTLFSIIFFILLVALLGAGTIAAGKFTVRRWRYISLNGDHL